MAGFTSARLQNRRQERRAAILTALALLGMMVFAVAVSYFFLLPSSIRLDEAQSLFQTSRNVQGMLTTVGQDVHVPLYHTILHFYRKIISADIGAARLVSLAFFAATIPLTYHLGRYAFKDRRVGLFAALLVTLSPFMNWYGSEARMYTMLAFMTVLHQLLFLKVLREGKSWHWLGLIIVGILGVYTHYFFTLVIFTEGVFYVFKRRQIGVQRKLLWLKFLGAGALIMAALVPWLLFVYSLGTASNTQPHLGAPTSIDVFNTYAQFLFGFQGDFLNTVVVSLWPLSILLAFFALQRHKQTPPLLIFFALGATLPIATAFVLSFIKPFYLSRYLIVALPALCIFTSWILVNYSKGVSRAMRVALVLLVAAGLATEIGLKSTPVKEDYAGAVAYLERRAGPQDVIAVSAPFTIYPVEYYYNGNAQLTTLPVWDRFNEGSIPGLNKSQLPGQAKTVNGANQRIFLVLSFDQGYQQDIRDYYEGHYERLDLQRFSRGLTVYVYKLRYDPPIDVPAAREISDSQTP